MMYKIVKIIRYNKQVKQERMNRLDILRSCISNSTNQAPQTEYTKLSIYYKGNIAYISLRSPKDLNCLSQVMIKQICEALKQLHYDELVNVIVLVSQLNNIFCAGADIKQFGKPSFNYEFGVRYEPLHLLMEAFNKIRKPVIAAVNGKALGGGFQLALLCDIIVASQKAYFGLPEVTLGLMPGIGGTQKFTRIVGQKKAMRHILTGQGFPAEQAWRMNIAEKATSQKFNEQIQGLAQKISSKALTTIIIAKKAVKQASNMTSNQGLQFEKDVFYSMLNTKAAKQGITAFMNKKKPDFKGL